MSDSDSKEKFQKELAAFVRDGRRRSGLIREEFAERAGISMGSLRALESGDQNPQLYTFLRIYNVVRDRDPDYNIDELLPHAPSDEQVANELTQGKEEELREQFPNYGDALLDFRMKKYLLKLLGLWKDRPN